MRTNPWLSESKLQGSHFWGVVLAGGDGRRLQHFLKTEFGLDRPKQYCAIVGRRSMLRHTIDRASTLIHHAHLLTVICRHHLRYAIEDIYDRDPKTVITVPFNCETGPSILLPLMRIQAKDPEATVALFPSDHFVLEEDRFMNYVRAAFAFVSKIPEVLVTLGIVPSGMQSGYGWIEKGDLIGQEGEMNVYRVNKFWEKPVEELSQLLYAKGCMWNTLTLVGKVGTFLRLFKMCTPEVFSSFQRIWSAIGTPQESQVTYNVFKTLSSSNFSQAVLERSPQHLCVLPVRNVYWNDWGDENRIRQDMALVARHRRAVPTDPVLTPELYSRN